MSKHMKPDPFAPLDEYERKLMESLERGEWTPVEPQDQAIKAARETARNTIAKTERMNIRISKRDLTRLKERALQNGLPYQTLVGEIITTYLNSDKRS